MKESVSLSSRIIEFAGILESCEDACYSDSLKNDKWSTATELLTRRDELRMAGWNGAESLGLPPLAADLAHACHDHHITWPDLSERIHAILTALDHGQCLPHYRLILDEPVSKWPPIWQRVLERLKTELAEPTSPAALEGSMLRVAQLGILHGECKNLKMDSSLRWVSTNGSLTACEFVATVLGAHPERLPQTVVYCEDATVALCLDGCFERLGLPTLGAAQESLSHPVFQVLPLVLKMIWKPVDPELLLAFLSLPVSPLPKRASWRLAEALAEQPGLGSEAWNLAFKRLCEEDTDPGQGLNQRLTKWLHCERFQRGEAIPAAEVKTLCGRVAQWATGYATLYSEKDDVPASLVDALRSVAGQASTLGQLAETHGGLLSDPQITRLREAAMSFGGTMVPYPMAASGAKLVTSLAEIRTPCDQLVWLGQSTADRSSCHWSTTELLDFDAAGIHVDDGRGELAILRDAERRGFAKVAHSLLAVSLSENNDQKIHPFWALIRSSLPKSCDRGVESILLEDILTTNLPSPVGPWRFGTTPFSPKPSQPLRSLWNVPTGLLKDRERSSASELSDRLACPLKWVLNYQARITPSAIASLPDSFRLKGLFCHSVLELVFGEGGDLPDVESAVQLVARTFDERLPLDAAPLAQPLKIVDRQRLKDSLCSATRVLVNALIVGGYRIQGIEVEVEGKIQGRGLTGSIDCLAVRDDGQEAIIDFKFAGGKKYNDLIKEGRAVQLATYAYSRTQNGDAGKGFPAVAYLVIEDSRMISSHCDRLVGQSDGIEAKGIAEIWEAFADGLAGAEEWMTHRLPVPARPLQAVEDWPKGVDLILRAPTKKGETVHQETCKYCNYPALCGLKEMI